MEKKPLSVAELRALAAAEERRAKQAAMDEALAEAARRDAMRAVPVGVKR